MTGVLEREFSITGTDRMLVCRIKRRGRVFPGAATHDTFENTVPTLEDTAKKTSDVCP